MSDTLREALEDLAAKWERVSGPTRPSTELRAILAAHPDDTSTTKRPTVTPQHILDQRANGWPDMHPEDFCHICGTENMSWASTRADWLAATTPWAAATGREGICCPQCFADMHAENTGMKKTWMLIDSATFDALLGGEQG